MNNHSIANMNAVIFQVRQGGTAYYSSNYEPWGYYAGYNDPGYDPLEIAIEEAHNKGLVRLQGLQQEKIQNGYAEIKIITL